MTFKKGQSGNPKGRKKEDADVRALCRAMTTEILTTLQKWLRSDNAKASIAAGNILLNRGHGMPSQEVELTGQVNVFINRKPNG